jgi:hypothetical protein
MGTRVAIIMVFGGQYFVCPRSAFADELDWSCRRLALIYTIQISFDGLLYGGDSNWGGTG